MKLKIGQIVAGAVVAGLVGTGGMALAGAQEATPSTTTPTYGYTQQDGSTTAPAAPGQGSGERGTHAKGDCPNMGGETGSTGSGTSSSSSTESGNL